MNKKAICNITSKEDIFLFFIHGGEKHQESKKAIDMLANTPHNDKLLYIPVATEKIKQDLLNSGVVNIPCILLVTGGVTKEYPISKWGEIQTIITKITKAG